MKTIKTATLKAALLTAICVLTISTGNAQFVKSGYFNADWQVNIPLNNGFADKTSGWGMNFEGGYYLPNSDFAIGLFLNYHTNNEYIPMQTIALSDVSAITTDQQHSLFQLPFGASARYRLAYQPGVFDPYISMKLGAQYARTSSFYSVFETYNDSWGFYLSPEIGTVIYPTASHNFGFHLAAYFSYATNKSDLLIYSLSGPSNFGLRVGIAF